MGFFDSQPRFIQTPGAAGIGQQYKDWGGEQGLGKAGQIAKGGLKQFANGGGEGGYDTGIVGNLLAPLRDQYSTMQRESNRAYGMGGLGLAGGSQPALMARLKQLNEDKIGEQQGHAYAEAVPGIFGQLSNTFQNAQNSRRSAELAGMQGQLSAAQSGQWYKPKSIFDNIMSVGQLGAGIGSMVMGMPGMGKGRLPSFGGTGSSSFNSIINSVPHY